MALSQRWTSGTGGRGDTKRWALGAIGANEGWKQPFPILEQKEEKNRAKKSEKLRSREKKEWKLVKTMFFLTLSPNGSLDKRRKETRKRGNQERASAMIVDTYVHSVQVKAENQCNDCRYMYIASKLRLKPKKQRQSR